MVAEGLAEEEIRSHLEVRRGLHPVVAERFVAEVLARNAYPPMVQAAVRDCAARFAEFLEGGDLVRAVAKATGLEAEAVRILLVR